MQSNIFRHFLALQNKGNTLIQWLICLIDAYFFFKVSSETIENKSFIYTA